MDQTNTPVLYFNDKNKKDALGDLDVAFLRDNEGWVEAYKTVQWNDITSLDNLIKRTEQLVIKYKNPNSAIKIAIERIFEEVLGRYPLLFGYWKKFTAVQYQLNGLEKSLEVLSTAVDAFPHSLELWCDYLNVLLANSADKIDHIRTNFQLGKKQVGYQFLSHPFWDMYIKFETDQKQWENVAELYQSISKIPLHQYARYYSSYKAFLTQHPGVQPTDDVEKIFAKTQKMVNEIWKYESQIKQNFFNLSVVGEKELDNWDTYLSFIIKRSEYSKDLVKSVFERCLIPCQFYEYFWLKYASWSKNTSSFEENIDVFERGSKSLPLDKKQFRYGYLEFLKLSMRRNKEFVRHMIFAVLETYVKYWPHDIQLMAYCLFSIKRLKFSSSLTHEDQEILKQQSDYASYLEKNINHFLGKSFEGDHQLLNIMNKSNVALVIVELIKVTYLTLKNNIKTKKLFTSFGATPLLQDSVTFWLMYYRFLKVSLDFSEIEIFITRLGTDIFLPTSISNDIITDYKSFYYTNANIMTHEQSMIKNQPRRTLDPLIEIDLKINDPQFKGTTEKYVKTEWQKSPVYKENGHIGISIERPSISNTIIEQDSKLFGNTPPALPTFKNLEKMNKTPIYIDNSIQDLTPGS